MTVDSLAQLVLILSVFALEPTLVLLQPHAPLIQSTRPSLLAIVALDTNRTPTSPALILMSAQLELLSAQTVLIHLPHTVSTLMALLLAVLTLILMEFALQELPELPPVS